MVTENKVSDKELKSAYANFMKSAQGQLPAGMIPQMAPALMGVMNSPAAMPQPLGINQMVNGYPMASGQSGMNPYANAGIQITSQVQQTFQGQGLAVRVKYGPQKHKDFGLCEICASCSLENTADPKNAYCWCNSKMIRVDPKSGLVMKEIDNAGKKEQIIDREKSCRSFKKIQ